MPIIVPCLNKLPNRRKRITGIIIQILNELQDCKNE